MHYSTHTHTVVIWWEVFNRGKTPYGGFSPTCVKTMISDGYRLEAPSNSACNDDM